MKHLLIISSLFILFNIDLNSQSTWIPTNGPMALSLSAFTVSSDGVWVVSATRQGVFFSTDQGKSWTKRSTGLDWSDSYATSLASGPDGIIYAIIDDEFYRMEKGIREWVKSNYKFIKGKIKANLNGSIFVDVVGLNRRIYFSNNKGELFNSIPLEDYPNFFALSLNGNNNNFLIGEDKDFNHFLVRFSDDGKLMNAIRKVDAKYTELFWHPKGKLFMLVSSGEIIRMDSAANIEVTINNNFSIQQLDIKPNGDLFVMTNDADYVSSDLGDNWTKLGTNLYKIIPYSFLEFYGNDSLIAYDPYCSSGTNILQSSFDSGKNWTNYGDQFVNSNYENLINSNGVLYAVLCGNSYYHYTKDKGQTWSPLPLPNYYGWLTTSSKGYVYFIYDYKVMFSKDVGKNWIRLVILNDQKVQFIVSDKKNSLFAMGSNFSYISMDGGQVWDIIKTPPTENITSLYTLSDGTLFAIREELFSIPSIYKSTDLGLNWAKVSLDFTNLFAFTVLRDNSIIFSASFNNEYGTFISNDKLASYLKVSLKEFNAIIEDQNENLYAFNSFEDCQFSRDKGKTWNSMTNGLPVTNQKDLYDLTSAMVIDDDGYLYLAYRNYPIFRTVNQLTNSTEPSSSSNNISLHSTIVDQHLILNFENSYNGLLDFSIYDQMGKIVLSEKRSIRDTKQLIVNVDQLNSGMYFINTQCKNRKNKLFKFIKT
jgi:photosystem II stability/assembly factor-like uncharacterized protein